MGGDKTLPYIFGIVEILVTWFFGLFSKKCTMINNKIIPLQNLFIGLFTAYIYYLITGDINLVIASVGLTTGGTYDVINNLKKLFSEKDNP